jgi:tRNA 2-thiouridine synthesizing protein A
MMNRDRQNNSKNNMGVKNMADKYLDCTQLKCPMPIVKLSKELKQMTSGQTLTIEASDPAFASDVQAWVKTTGHELLELTEGPVQKAVIRKR